MTDCTKLTLYFRRVPLGFLERTEGGYQYTSYIDNEQILSDLLFASDYTLFGSYQREKKELSPEFTEILTRCSRKDIRESAGIDDRDSMWEQLVKLSRLSFLTPNFYVQQTSDIEEESRYHLKPT